MFAYENVLYVNVLFKEMSDFQEQMYFKLFAIIFLVIIIFNIID